MLPCVELHHAGGPDLVQDAVAARAAPDGVRGLDHVVGPARWSVCKAGKGEKQHGAQQKKKDKWCKALFHAPPQRYFTASVLTATAAFMVGPNF